MLSCSWQIVVVAMVYYPVYDFPPMSLTAIATIDDYRILFRSNLLFISHEFANVTVTSYFAAHIRSVISCSILHIMLWNFVYSLRYMLSRCSEHQNLQYFFFDFPIFHTWLHIPGRIKCLLHEFKQVLQHKKIHVNFIVCNAGACKFLG